MDWNSQCQTQQSYNYAKDLGSCFDNNFFQTHCDEFLKFSFYQEHIIISIFQFLINRGKIPNSKGLEQKSDESPCIYIIYSL